MIFSSILFVMLFLPVVLAVYYVAGALIKNKNIRMTVQNIVLLVFSILFYAFGGLKYLILMLAAILINYFAGIVCAPTKANVYRRKVCFVLAIVADVLILLFFKAGNQYFDIVLPIGISFYLFQALSYVIDVYLGKVPVQTNVLDFALYISFFPQLIAGPIVQYKDISKSIRNRSANVVDFATGIKRFVYGLAKKVIIANTMAEVADKIWALEISKLGSAVAILAAISYTMQIYYDFSGYSDMAIGLGKMFGFKFRENFNYPYMSDSIQDFWRRWHMSLSSWFRDYVYIPLGGSRNGNRRTYYNLMVVFVLTGLWHGANATFVFWGLAYGVILCLERAFLGRMLKANRFKIIGRLYSFVVVALLWVVFRSDDIFQAFGIIGQIFAGGSGTYSVLSYLSIKVMVILVVAILLSGVLQKWTSGLITKVKDTVAFGYVEIVVCMGLFLVSLALLLTGSYNPFIYYQF